MVQYFDSDSSGSNPECTVPHTKDLKEVVTLLASEKRQAVITEFGGGNNPDCASVLAQFVQEANQVSRFYVMDIASLSQILHFSLYKLR